MIKFNAPLPHDELFCPKLSCQVYDNIFKGFGNQPLIGNFTIPIGQLMQDLKEERRVELAAIDHIITELDGIIKDEAVSSYINNTIDEGEEKKDPEAAEEEVKK